MRVGPECKKIGKKGCGKGGNLLYYSIKLPGGPVPGVGRLWPERFRRFGKTRTKGESSMRKIHRLRCFISIFSERNHCSQFKRHCC